VASLDQRVAAVVLNCCLEGRGPAVLESRLAGRERTPPEDPLHPVRT